MSLMPSWMSEVHSRFYTVRELWSIHGWPVMESGADDDVMSFRLQNLSITNAVKMVGNGIHLPTNALFYLFCLSSLCPREVLERIETPLRADSDDDDKDSNQDVKRAKTQ